MKKFIVTDSQTFQTRRDSRKATQDLLIEGFDTMQVSDGFHTMDELYEHRIVLFIALCSVCEKMEIWRSKLHSDGTMFDGQFILGMKKEAGEQITYHLPLKYWSYTEFAETLEEAPEWDQHTSSDVLERLKNLFLWTE